MFARGDSLSPSFLRERLQAAWAWRQTVAAGASACRVVHGEGVLGVGCHGPGAPDGALEGVIASKGHVTYWDGQAPVGGVDANRTVFHVM